MVQQTNIYENCPEQAKLVRDNFVAEMCQTLRLRSMIHPPRQKKRTMKAA